MGAQKKDTEYNVDVIYCKPNNRYYIHDFSGKLPLAELNISTTLCGNDEVIKTNLTYKEAKAFLSIILKLKSIPT